MAKVEKNYWEKVRLDEERSDELNGNIGAVKGVATIFTSS